MFQRILVPLDGSSRALLALPVAAHLARSVGGSIIVLRVVSPALEEWPTLDFSPPSRLAQSIAEGDLAEAERYVAEMTMSPDLHEVATETVVLLGPVTPTILSVASSYRADLIVIGGHRATGRSHWLNGCVAERVARHAPVPVLILREGGPALIDPHLDAINAQRILVPLDGSALAESVLAPAASMQAVLATSSRSTLHLTRIVHPDEVQKDARVLEAAQHYLSTVVARCGLAPETICSVGVHADVASALIAIAEQGKPVREDVGENRCALIALATHGRSGVQRLVLGSVTERVLSAAMVPLLIVRPLAPPAQEPDPHYPLT